MVQATDDDVSQYWVRLSDLHSIEELVTGIADLQGTCPHLANGNMSLRH
jgi:hypothetical protein